MASATLIVGIVLFCVINMTVRIQNTLSNNYWLIVLSLDINQFVFAHVAACTKMNHGDLTITN